MMRMGEPIRLSQKTGNLDKQAEMRKEQADSTGGYRIRIRIRITVISRK
jgi:hypothetical protein